MEYYEKIKYVRISKNITQEQMAKLINVTSEQYVKYESGTEELSIEKLVDFCLATGISSNYILDLPCDFKYPEK